MKYYRIKAALYEYDDEDPNQTPTLLTSAGFYVIQSEKDNPSFIPNFSEAGKTIGTKFGNFIKGDDEAIS